ncbi:MAG: arsenate reductase (glutaredoxin) [Planctomycetales bacterium]|nr:arsenate reductase (glutaredoxin) [Planctomycetales bacterium]MCA9174521.1 arsenate reductase (glutaredoxin) [Planctomycetales bacterium]
MKAVIYHNPRCTKSRQTLALLREHDVDIEVIEYLDTPLDAKELRALLKKLGMRASEIVRRKEYRELGLPDTEDEDELVALIAAHPKIMERPIVVVGKAARIGRPPEQVLELL